MRLKGEQVLVTGAGGFIGSHLVEELVHMGAKVRALVHYNARNDWGMLELIPKEIKAEIEVFPGDITDPFLIHKAVKGCKVVFHLAALIAIPFSYIAPESFVNTNIKGSLNIFQACLEEEVDKVVHTSTSEVYGSAQYVPIDEKHPLQGQSPYSASKIGADMMAESFYRSFNLPVATIRPFNTYGPRQSSRAVIPTIFTQLINDSENIKLGTLSTTRDFNFVKDTIRGFILMAECEDNLGQVINIGSGVEISIGDLVEKIAQIAGKLLKVKLDTKRIRPEKSEVDRLCADNRQAKEILGWQPEYSLDEGLRSTIHWFTQHVALYKSDIYNV